MRRFVAVSVVAVTLGGAGCTSDAPGGEGTTPPSAVVTDADSTTSTVASTSTSTSTTSTTTSTTSTTSTTTTTTTSPPTTIDPVVEIEAAIKQARLDLEVTVLAVGMDPANESLRAALLDYVTPERYVALESFFDDLVLDGLLVRQNTETPAGVTFVSEVDLPNGAASTEAFVDACRVNSSVVYKPLEGGDEVIIDDTITTTLSRLRLILVESQWVLESTVRLASWDGANSCRD